MIESNEIMSNVKNNDSSFDNTKLSSWSIDKQQDPIKKQFISLYCTMYETLGNYAAHCISSSEHNESFVQLFYNY